MIGPSGDAVRSALEKAIGFQYEIIRLLGRGGMGAVYHAHEKALDRPVAIKVLPPDVAATADARERFLREARTAARLTHPHIVPLFTFGETSGLVYYVMGYVEGESLQQRLDRGGKLDSARAAKILDQLAGALDYAHALDIVHRDVKPDNILIERGSGDAKLTDFGIAKRAAGGETLTGTGLLMGTPKYMSPEQASGDRELDARSDVYSLGLVGYAMLAGRPPFDGASVQDVLKQQVLSDAPSLRKLLPDAPSQLVIAVERALEKDPKQRWHSAGALRTALGEDESDLSGSPRKPGMYAIVNAVALLIAFNLVWYAAFHVTSEPLLWLSVLMPLGAVVDFLLAKYKEKRSPAELRRIFTEPPRWWPLWWPARWRRADDVWARLPADLREAREIGSLGVGVFIVMIEATYLTEILPNKIPLEWRASFLATLLTGLMACIGLIGLGGFRGWLVTRKLGVSKEDASRLVNAPTARLKFWQQPHIAKLLSPQAVDDGLGEPRSHAELVVAIASAVKELPDHRDAPEAARRLVAAIDALDDEIAKLARDADPAEAARLEARLASPGNEEMRKLYSSQLGVLRRLRQQRADAESRRARYAELLRTLWLQVAALRAQAAVDAAQATDVSGRIREICRNVQHEVVGSKEAAALLKR